MPADALPSSPTLALSLAAAIGAGLLIGIERERRKGQDTNRNFAGVRTFTVAALMGAVAETLGMPLMVLLGGALILVLSAIRYAREHGDDPGITTELALFITYLLGVHAIGHPRFAAGAAVILAALLYAREGLHRFSTELLTPTELRDALLLAGAALIVLPLIPARSFDWAAGINLRRLWALAVLFMAIQGVGHIALRALGPRGGLALSGLVAGFVSSTATTAAMGARAIRDPALRPSCIAGAWLSNVATALQLILITLTLYPAGLSLLRVPLLGMVLTALVLAWIAARRQPGTTADAAPGHAFDLWHSFGFAALLAGVTAAVKLVEAHYGTGAVTLGVAFAGFADAHSAAASALSLAASGRLDASGAQHCVLLAVTTNSVSKMLVAFGAGGWRYGLWIAGGLLLMLGAAWLPVLL